MQESINDRLKVWCRAAANISTLLGAAMIALIWLGIHLHLDAERRMSLEAAIQNSANLARAFEEHLIRSIKEVDRVLLFLRRNYEDNAGTFTLSNRAVHDQLFSDIASRIGIVGANGVLELSSGGPIPRPISLWGKEHFQTHIQATDDELFIGKPTLSRQTGEWVIPLTRRIRTKDGSFGGVIVATIDLSYFNQLYNTINVGADGAIALVGSVDGVFRASENQAVSVRGRTVTDFFAYLSHLTSPSGWYFSDAVWSDGVNRLVSYRTLGEFPLVVMVGMSDRHILASTPLKQRTYYVVATLSTALILLLVALNARRQYKLACVSSALRLQNIRFDTALNNMSQGLCMFDAEQRLVVCNDRYREIYGLPPAAVKPGTTIQQIFESRIASGLFAGASPADYRREVVDNPIMNGSKATTVRAECGAGERTPVIAYSTHVREFNDGRTIAVVAQPMEGGGWVATHEDVTRERRREESFRLLFERNPVPMWVSDRKRLRFLAVNAAAIARYGYSREQFLAMTVPELLPAGERERFAHFMRSLSDSQLTENVGQHRKSDGTVMDVAVSSQTLIYDGHHARLAAVHDITQAKQAERELRRVQNFLDTVIEHVPLPIVVRNVAGAETGADGGRFTLFNRAYEELTGESRVELIGKAPHEIYPKERADLIVESDREALQFFRPVLVHEHSIVTSAKGKRLVTARKVAIRNDGGKPQYLVTVLDDVTDRRRAEERIRELAHNDPLTGLPNRATFMEHFAAALEHASKAGGQVALLSADLDRFKEVNDAYGHLVGDKLLREVARRLEAAAAGAFVARLGGDEFALIVANGLQPETAEALGARVLGVVQEHFEVDGHRLRLGASVGGAVYPTDGADATTLMANADAALYQAKVEARGSARFFDAEMGERLRERRNLQNELCSAIDRGDLLLHYQPQKRTKSNETVGFEALVRWQCPKRGMLSPRTFIPIAEESGLIMPMGEMILRAACRQAASWRQPIKIAVNVSPVQFQHGDLPELVHSILLETGLAPARLELEITEGALINDFSRAVAILRKLKSLGVQIALDDFGTGFSSLSYVHAFPFDRIKIDRTFIGDLERNHHSMAIVRAIITLGSSLDVPILAEGVETEAQRSFLAREGCEEVQGYLTGRPQPIEDYAALVGDGATDRRGADWNGGFMRSVAADAG